MAQRQRDRELDEVVVTAERILAAHGYQVVTADSHLFPNGKPALLLRLGISSG